MMWTARVRTQALALEDPVDITSLTLVERYGQPDSLVFDAALESLPKTPGSGIVVWDDSGRQRFSGWLTPLTRARSSGTAAYVSDTQLLWDRTCWPDPTHAWTAPTQAIDTVTGSYEARILALIQRNAGSLAYNGGVYVRRRVTTLRLPTSLNRGATGTTGISLRPINLGELVARYAEFADLRVTIKQTYEGTTPYLDVVVDDTPDLSAWARFGDASTGDLGLLGEDWSYTLGAHTASIILPVTGTGNPLGDAYLGGVVTSSARETTWGRYIEQYLDLKGTTDTDEISERTAEAINESVPTVEVQAPIVAGDLEFGTGTGQIPLGAKVAVSLDGELVVERIRQVTTTVQAAEGSPTVTVEPLVGSPESGLTVEQKTLRAALRRLRRLEGR